MKTRGTWAGLVLACMAMMVQAGPVEDARTLIEQGKPQEALATLERHLQAVPTDAAGQLLLGVIQIRSGDGTKGAFTVRKAVFLDESLRAQAHSVCTDYLVPLARAGRFDALPPLVDALQKLKAPPEKVDAALTAVLDLARKQTNAPAQKFIAAVPTLAPDFAARHPDINASIRQAQMRVDRLAAHYTFDGNAEDVSGQKLHGKALGGARFVEDRFGKNNAALGLDGNGGNYVSLAPNRPVIGMCSNFTISAWVYPQTRRRANPVFVHSAGANSIVLTWSAPWGTDEEKMQRFHFAVMQGPNKMHVIKSPQFERDQWHHVAASHDGRALTLYVDGKAVASQPLAGAIDWNTGFKGDFIGAAPDQESFFTGRIDDVRIHLRTLAPEEIAKMAQHAGPPPQARPSADQQPPRPGDRAQDWLERLRQRREQRERQER